MNSKKIIIYEYDILFEILDEIKEKLNFTIVKANKKNYEQIKKDVKEDFLLISQSSDQNLKNYFIIEKKPLKIDKLIEKINLKFLENKFSAQSKIKAGLYELNLNSREISKDGAKISLTEREINLIIFLKNAEKPVKIDELQKKVWDYGSELETHTVETHIYRLRKKIKKEFNDENFIISEKNGYFIK
tara:strand:- start:172 stop:735 length:564 start_codon:yes stop_codon:yes gene_type:complete